MRFVITGLLLALAACSQDGPALVASDVEITEPMPGRNMSAGFMLLTNNSDSEIRISTVTSPAYGDIEIHESSIEDGVARMREIEELVVPANASVTLERGGLHLMLMEATGNPDTISLTFMSGETPLLELEAAIKRRSP